MKDYFCSLPHLHVFQIFFNFASLPNFHAHHPQIQSEVAIARRVKNKDMRAFLGLISRS